jgi:hypothetical protein
VERLALLAFVCFTALVGFVYLGLLALFLRLATV